VQRKRKVKERHGQFKGGLEIISIFPCFCPSPY
jgi:hypothetical protein